MSSLKDQLSFYYSSVDFEHFLKFFNYFQKKEFYYPDFKKYYDEFTDYICDYAQEIPAFVEDPLKLLQLLYDCNVIVAIENKTYFHYSYREKSNANIEPKVPKGNNVKYRFHYGMYKKTKFGRF